MRLQGKAILIIPDDNPEKTSTGIINPVMLEKPNTGKVVDKGPGCELVLVGDKVMYHRKGASVIMLEGKEAHFIIEDQIIYVHGNDNS